MSRGRLPVWAYVADAGGLPPFRGRCAECPWDGPIHSVPARTLIDPATLEAARNAAGPVYEAARKAEGDLIAHLWERHGIRVPRRPRSAMRWNIGRPPQ